MSYIKEWEKARRIEDYDFKPPKEHRKYSTIYIVVNLGNPIFKVGDVLKLIEDDNSSAPKFEDSDGIRGYCNWYHIKLFIEEPVCTR